MYFNDQMFNPATVNPQYYNSIRQQINQYEWAQNEEIIKAIKATHDLCDAVKRMDEAHQRIAFAACLQQLANDFNWR